MKRKRKRKKEEEKKGRKNRKRGLKGVLPETAPKIDFFVRNVITNGEAIGAKNIKQNEKMKKHEETCHNNAKNERKCNNNEQT